MPKTFQKGQKYILRTGSLFRPNPKGVGMIRHIAPFEFVPTYDEWVGNQDRLVLVADEARRLAGDVKETPRDAGIGKVKLTTAKRHIAVAGSISELDELEAQELARPKPRAGVIAAIGERRDELAAADNESTKEELTLEHALNAAASEV